MRTFEILRKYFSDADFKAALDDPHSWNLGRSSSVEWLFYWLDRGVVLGVGREQEDDLYRSIAIL